MFFRNESVKIDHLLNQGWGNFCKSKAVFQITGNQLGRNL